MSATPASTPGQRAVLELVRRYRHTGGRTLSELAREANLSMSSVSWALRKFRLMGLVANDGNGNGTRWLPVAEAAVARKRRDRTRAQRLLDTARHEAMRRTRKDLDAFYRPPIKRVVPAAQCPPIRIRGPVSVFHQKA